MNPFYAMIVPMEAPGSGEPGRPPGIWGGAPVPWPTPPIYYPPSVWPPSGHPEHPIYWPPSIWPQPGRPAHPIVLPPLPGSPPGIWGGSNEPFPTPPIYLPGEKPNDPPKPAEGWSWAYSPIYGWVVLPPGGGGKPQPPASPEQPAARRG